MTEWKFEEVISPPGNIFYMRPFVTYMTRETILSNKVTFIVPSSEDVNVGDEFRVCSSGRDAVGWIISTPDRSARFWLSFPDGIHANGISLKADDMARHPPVTVTAHIACFDNSNPLEAQYQLWNQNGYINVGNE